MTANAFVFTIEIGGTPTLTFEAQNLREAHELCHEQWLKDDLAEAKSDSVPLAHLVAIDPSATSASVSCCSSEANFSPFQNANLSAVL
jgi:hypothetical protein